MADETNDSDFVCIDTASSTTEDRPTPSTVMSGDAPANEKRDEALKERNSSSDSNVKETKEINQSHDNLARHIEHHPIPGRIYIIRTRQEPRRVLSVRYGSLILLRTPKLGDGVLWYCLEKRNWYSFYNRASGASLGYSGTPGRMAALSQVFHEAQQCLMPIRQEGGGYILHTLHPETGELWQVAVEENEYGGRLFETKAEGTALDFIDTKYLRSSISLALPNMEEEILFKQE
ncbi:uncharacterized protein Triagg1_2192 [Trichoderma aggressivum f. europaeum]|uniref:Uncharacterized protein n=1 Tax=Trichoderma aggressivum f. europaeum TaxID=173218 RepID=A0AAE1M5U5_9HYPO|nr:hypothetical protein Triagg1_2192 [Trichoderma aggressivum f. europaeum]